jgi:hypothetical protein
LINSPVVAMGNKARLARGADDVKSFLGQDVPPPPKPKGLSPRMAALMNGRPVPAPPPEDERPKDVHKAEAVKHTQETVLKIEPGKRVLSIKRAAAPNAEPVPAKAIKVPTLKPAEKATPTPAPKPVKKAAPAKKAAKKK